MSGSLAPAGRRAASPLPRGGARGPGALRLLALLGLLAAPAGAAAQEAPPLQPGVRLRATVRGPEPRVRTGALRALGDTALTLGAGPATYVIPFQSIVRLERSLGRRPGVAGGAVGLVVGAAAGALLACAANRDSYGVFCGGQDDTRVVLGTAAGGLVGGAAGALLFRRERWRPLDPARLGRPAR